MPRVVLDTNIRVSSILFGGKPRELVSLLHPPEFMQLVSEPLLLELAGILKRKFRWLPHAISAELESVTARSLLVTPTQTIQHCRDPDDDRVLECAFAGHADFIVTGDRDLIALRVFERIPILTIRQFLDQLPART